MGPTEIITFGCRLNAYESEVMRALAARAGLEGAVIVNTCAVTAEAERQARQTIRRVRRTQPGARIVVTGCAAQIAPERFAAMPEVDRVLGNTEKVSAEAFAGLADAAGPRTAVADIMLARETAGHLIAGFDERARAFLQVQQGCDHRCTFCIIPYGRGPSRSVPVGAVVDQARAFVEAGYREIVLTGVDLTAYGGDLPGRPPLGQMARRLLALVPGIERLRISSVDPIEVDADLVRLIAEEPRLMPHLHLSLQSGDDLILKRMKRRHGRKDAIQLCARLRALRPGIAFGADLIAGFPTESEAMFQNTLDAVAECGIAYLHVFPFSARPGTPAARMRKLDGKTVRDRARTLRRAGEAALSRHLAGRIGGTAEVLVERDNSGRDRDYAPVRLAGPAHAPGALVRAKIEAVDGATLVARPAS